LDPFTASFLPYQDGSEGFYPLPNLADNSTCVDWTVHLATPEYRNVEAPLFDPPARSALPGQFVTEGSGPSSGFLGPLPMAQLQSIVHHADQFPDLLPNNALQLGQEITNIQFHNQPESSSAGRHMPSATVQSLSQVEQITASGQISRTHTPPQQILQAAEDEFSCDHVDCSNSNITFTRQSHLK